jgi:hypothetical protein
MVPRVKLRTSASPNALSRRLSFMNFPTKALLQSTFSKKLPLTESALTGAQAGDACWHLQSKFVIGQHFCSCGTARDTSAVN